MFPQDEFKKYAIKHKGISSLNLHRFQTATNSYITPNIIEERQLNIAPIDDDVANIIMAQLLFLETADPGRDIQLYFNSPGGSIYAGLGIYDTMQYINCDVATICTGLAASMAAVLMTAGTKGKRSALTHSRIMIHQPMSGVQGQAADIEITSREVQKLKKELYTIISEHSGQPYKKVEKDSDRDYWMTAAEAKEYGMIDSILTRAKK